MKAEIYRVTSIPPEQQRIKFQVKPLTILNIYNIYIIFTMFTIHNIMTILAGISALRWRCQDVRGNDQEPLLSISKITKLNSAVMKMTKMTKITLLMMITRWGSRTAAPSTWPSTLPTRSPCSTSSTFSSFSTSCPLPSPDPRRLLLTSCFQGSYREI